MTEQQLQRLVLDYLTIIAKQKPIYYFRSAAGSVKTQTGRFFKTGKPGCPDLSLVINGQYHGWELKAAKGRQTAAQKQAEKEITAAGGQYHIVRSLDDVKRILS